MKKLLIILLGLLIATPVFALSTFQVFQGGTGATTLTGCLTGNGTNPITGSGIACGSGGGLPWPFTKQASGAQATSTLMEFIGGFMSDASSSVNALFQATNATTTNWSSTIASTSIFYLSGIKDAILTVDANSKVVASSTIGNNQLQNNTISTVALGGTLATLSATNPTLTFSGAYTGASARTIGLNVGNANDWTALQTFTNSSSTLFSSTIASTSQLCIGGDCRTAWPTTGTFAFPFTKQADNYQATSTGILLSGGLVSSASTTVGGASVATGLTINGGATSTSDFLHLGSTTLQGFVASQGTTTQGTSTNYAVSSLSKDSLVASNKSGGLVSTSTIGANQTDSTIAKSATTITVAGTANQITSSAGAQDLTANRTWTLSLPNNLNLGTASTTIIGSGNAYFGTTATSSFNGKGELLVIASTTLQNATSSDFFVSGLASTTNFRANVSSIGLANSFNLFNTGSTTVGTLFGASLTTCSGGSNALNWASGAFSCNSIAGGTNNSKWASSTDLNGGVAVSIFPSGLVSGDKQAVVGIGTTTNSYKLAQLAIASSTQSQLSLIYGAATAGWSFMNTGIGLEIGSTSPTSYATSTPSAITVADVGEPALSVGSSTAPNLPLGRFTLNNNGTAFQNALWLGSSGLQASTSMVITNNGQVGFATSSPFAQFSIHTASSSQTVNPPPYIFAIGSTTANSATGAVNSPITLYAIDNLGRTFASSTRPTLTSCGSGATVQGSDSAGLVRIGTTGTTQACIITFSKSWGNAPYCFVTPTGYAVASAKGQISLNASTTATVLTVMGTATSTTFVQIGGYGFMYECLGDIE